MGYAPMLDEMLGVYSIDRSTVHLFVAGAVLLVVGAITLAVLAIRRSRGLYRDGLDSDREMVRMDFRTWRDGYIAAAADDDAHRDLIDTIGIDLLGVPPRPDVQYPPPPVVSTRPRTGWGTGRTLTFGD